MEHGVENPPGATIGGDVEEGWRCWAQFREDEDELWFRGTVIGVHLGPRCPRSKGYMVESVDVEYDDGDIDRRKPLHRLRAIEDEEGVEEEEEEGVEKEGGGEEEGEEEEGEHPDPPADPPSADPPADGLEEGGGEEEQMLLGEEGAQTPIHE